jgi:hypothetical protein
VSDSIQAQFDDKGKLLQLAEQLGDLKFPPGRVEGVRVKSRVPSGLLVTWQCVASPSITAYLVEVAAAGEPYRVVYEGPKCEYVAEGFVVEEDILYYFRVAAVNDVGIGPYSTSTAYTQRKASFLWDPNQRHPRTHISNGGYTVSIGENATWVSAGANTVLTHGRHYWEVVLEKYGSPSLSRKAVIGVVASTFHHWRRSHGIIGIKTCPIGNRSWGLACGTAKKLSHGSTFLNSLGRKHNLFREGDAVGVMLDLSDHTMEFYRNGKPLGIFFTDVYGPVIPAVSFCRHKTLTLRFPSSPPPSPISTHPVREGETTQGRARSRSCTTAALMAKEKITKTNSLTTL